MKTAGLLCANIFFGGEEMSSFSREPSRCHWTVVLATMVLFNIFLPAFAAAGQTAQEKTIQEAKELESVTVTAQKQEENVQEVPISISVFTNQAVEDSGIQSVLDLADFVPNLSIYQNAWSNIVTPSMRGIHAHAHTLSTSTALYVDGVPKISCMGYDDGLLDVERIEVLRGPQGTLYGKNAEAGAISIITRQPDNEFRGKVSAEGGTFLSAETGDGLGGTFSASLSGPLMKDKLYAGFAGKYYQHDGFIENIATNDTANDKEHWYGHGHLRWTPTDRLDVSLIVSSMEQDDGGPDFGMTDWGLSQYGLPPNGYRQESSNIEAYNQSTETSQSLKFTYDLNNAFKLTSVTARRVYKDRRWSDLDLSQMTLSHSKMDSQFEKISQELRVNYTHEKLKWLTGFYYDNDNDDYFNEVISDYAMLASTTDRRIDGDAYAVFTNVTWSVLQDLNVVSGLRYERQNSEIKDNVSGGQRADSWESVTPKLALEYFFTHRVMSYIGATKGFRSGGFNVPDVGSQYESFDQEELWSYEAGLKSTFLENRLIVNTAVYYMDIENMQVDEAISYLETYTTNAAEASGYGLETDITARLCRGLSMTAGFAVSHLEFDKFQDALGNYQGNTPSYAPGYTFNIGAQYRHGSGFYFRADLIGYGKIYLDNANAYSRDAYEIVNAKAGYETERFDIYLYGKNIFDKEYDLVGYSGGYGIVYSEPGEIGLKLTCRF